MKADFDAVVVGTSPLLLLQAIELAKAKKCVCILDSSDNPGGAWQTKLLEDSSRVEIACHLIEVFPQVYEYLERVSEIPFVQLRQQPIRITPSGASYAYFSKLALVSAGTRLLLVYFYLHLKKLFCSVNAERYLNFKTKSYFFLRYQLRYLLFTPKMKGPKTGFVDFLDKLLHQSKHYGAEFRHFQVEKLEQKGSTWLLEDNNGNFISTSEVYLSCSANLKSHAQHNFIATESKPAVRKAYVVEIENEKVLTSQTYVGLWKDPIIARISRLDSKESSQSTRFLLEVRADCAETPTDMRGELAKRLLMARIISKEEDFIVSSEVGCHYSSHADQLPSGEISPGLYGCYSNGNLAAGIAYWLEHK